MHKTTSGQKIKRLKEEAHFEMKISRQLRLLDLPTSMAMAEELEQSSYEKIRSAQELRVRARLEDLKVYELKVKRRSRKGKNRIYLCYTYWYASWRNNGKIINVCLGNTERVSKEEAQDKARKIKSKFLGID